MATFNTAFGSLPSPKTQLYGNRASGGTGAQQPRATGQIEQKEAPGAVGGTETFAQLQQQGRARPAPPAMGAPVQQPDMLTALSAQLGQPEPVTPSTMFQPSMAPQAMAPAPAPEPAAAPMTPAPAAAATTPMLATLGSRLVSAEDVEEQQRTGPITTGGTGAGAGTTPVTGTPVTGTPAPTTMGYSATGGITGTPQIDRATDTATYTNVEVPVANAPRFRAGEVPPPTAPNGSTFVANTGTTWTKRGGVWTVEGQDVRGYAALTPPELLAQSPANLPAGAGAGTFTMGGQQEGVDQFLRQYGTPSTEGEFAALASQTGITVDALKSYIASAKGNLRFDSKQEVEARAEEQAWKAQNNVGNLPYNYAYVPASQGGPGIRKLSFDEVTARGFQPYGGRAAYDNPANDVALARGQGYANLLDTFEIGRTQKIGAPTGQGAQDLLGNLTTVLKTTPTTGGGRPPIGRGTDPFADRAGGGASGSGVGTGGPVNVGLPSGNLPTGGGTPATAGGGLGLGTGGAGGGVTGGVTGGGMGGGTMLPQTPTPTIQPLYAAPTGPQGALPPYGALTDTASDLRAKLMAQLDLLTGPSQIQGQSYEALRKAKADELAAQYGAERSKLEEELARRGLSASTIGGGRYGDLAGQQARAVAGFEADLLQQQAEADLRRQQMMLTGMSDLTRIESDISFRAAQLQQEAALRGRELDLQSARDMATSEYQRGQLGLGYAEIGSRERVSAADIGSRERMQTTELSAQEKRQLADINAQRELQTGRQGFEAQQSLLERTLREKMQRTELTSQEKRQLAEIEANKAAQADRQRFETEQRQQTERWQAEQSKLDRDLRALLSKQDIDAAQARFEKTYKLDMERFGFEKGQAANQFLSQLAAVLAPMDPRKRDEFLRTIGLDPKKLGLNQPAPGIGDIPDPGQS